MRKILIVFLVLAAHQLAFGQGAAAGNPVVVNGVGQPMAGVTVAICKANPGPNPSSLCSGTALATLYTDVSLNTPCTGTLTALNNQNAPSVGSGCSNPGLSDGLGNVIAFSQVGTYWCEYTGLNIAGIAVAFCQFPGIGSGGGGGTVNGATLNQGLALSGAGTTLGLQACPGDGQTLQYSLIGANWNCVTAGTVNAGTANQLALYSGSGAAVSGDSGLTDTGLIFAYLDIFRTAYLGPVGGTPGSSPDKANNICFVDGVTNPNIQSCQDKAENYPTNNGVRSIITFSNIPEDITVDLTPPNGNLELYLGTGYHSTSFGTPPNVNTWTLEVPIILGQGSLIQGTGSVSASNADMSAGTVITNGPNFPPPLGVPTVTPPTCGTGTGSLSNNTDYFVMIRTANNLETHPGRSAVMGPSMPTGEFTVHCGAAGNTISGTAPSAVGNSPFQAQDYQIFLSSVSGGELLQYSSATGSPNPLVCTAGVVSSFNGNNWGCKMTAGFTINSVQTGTRPPQLVDLSNPMFVFAPSQTVAFNINLKNLSIICQNGSTAQSNQPNAAIWNVSGEEYTNLSGVQVSNCGGGYGAGAAGTTGGSATAFPGAGAYYDTHTPNSSISNFNVAGGPPNTLSNPGSYYSIIFDGNLDSTGVAAGTAGLACDITVTPKTGGATVPAAILVTGSRARVNFCSRLHIETTTPNADGVQCTNGAYCEFHGIEVQAATTGNAIHATSTVGVVTGTGACPIGTANSGQNKCSGLGGMKTFKDDTASASYTGYLANFTTSTANSYFGNVTCVGTCTGFGSGGATLQTNGVNNASQSTLNFITSTVNAAGLTATPVNSGSTQKIEINGTAALAAAFSGTPSLCSAGNAPTGILANGNATGCSPVGGLPAVVYSTATGSRTSALGATTMATAGSSGNTYRFTAYASVTALGTSCTTPTSFTIQLIYTDPNVSSTTTQSITSGTLQLATTNGVLGHLSDTASQWQFMFDAKASTAVQYQVAYSAGSGCSPGPGYNVDPILEVMK